MPSQKRVSTDLMRIDRSLREVLEDIQESENLRSMRAASKSLAKKFKKKKRGQLSDYAIPIILSLALGLSLFVLAILFSETGAGLTEALSVTKTTGINNTIDFLENAPNNFDYLFLIFFVGVHLVLFIISYLIPTTPLLTPFFLLGAIVVWLITPMFSNIWEAVSTSGVVSSITASMPIMNVILSNLPYIELVTLCILMIIFFGKNLGVQQ